MTQFVGTHRNRIDAKGRVSVPAAFRASLSKHAERANDPDAGQIVLFPSHNHACIEAWPRPVFDALAAPLDTIDLFSPERDNLAATLYGDACFIEPDREGRIVLPDEMAAHAGVSDAVAFIGLGRTFQIWEPEAGDRRRSEAREHTRAHGLTLKARAA